MRKEKQVRMNTVPLELELLDPRNCAALGTPQERDGELRNHTGLRSNMDSHC